MKSPDSNNEDSSNLRDPWTITPATAHPRARKLLADSAIWDYGDEDSPLGNDTGFDTFAGYLEFRSKHPREEVETFIRSELASLGVPHNDWDQLAEPWLRHALNEDNGFRVLVRDDFIIALAFAQFL
jgi:uncharacterized protein YfeS